MSIYKTTRLLMALGLVVLLASCEKNDIDAIKYDYYDETQPRLKVIFTSSYRSNPGFQIKVNDQRVSSLLSFTSGNPTPFPGGGLQTGGGSTTDYLGINTGQNTISVARPFVGTNNDSVVLASAAYNFESGKKYSLYFTDTAANTTSLLVEDSLTAPDSGFVRLKFINLMPDMAAGVDLYLGTTKLVSALPYKEVSPSFVVPTSSSGVAWGIRAAGAGTNLHTYNATALATSNQRVLTIIARGYSTITTSTDTRKRAVSLIYN